MVWFLTKIEIKPQVPESETKMQFSHPHVFPHRPQRIGMFIAMWLQAVSGLWENKNKTFTVLGSPYNLIYTNVVS